jgi:hypothetical protein
MFLWLKQKKYFAKSALATDNLQEILLENRGNHRPATSHWQTISHNVVSSTTPHREGIDVTISPRLMFIVLAIP